MSLISKFWNNFKTQPDIWFFFGFLLTFTLSIRKVLSYFPLQKNFNEYSGIYIYLSDIFLILIFIFWFISILCNNLLSLSRIRLWITRVLHNLYIILPLFLVFLSFLSILWSQNVSIAIFRSFKLLELYLLYIYIIFRFIPQLFHACPPKNCSTPIYDNNVPRPPAGEAGGTLVNEKQDSNFDCSTWNNFGRVEQLVSKKIGLFFNIIIISSLIQAIIGIIQFFLQKSIGLFWLRESLVSPDILGVAKIILNGEKYVRAYGLMPHPNVLGGFLLFSVIITLLYKKLFSPPHRWTSAEKNIPHPISLLTKERVAQNVPRGTLSEENIHSISNCSTWNNCKIENTWSFRLIIAVQILALILTFSKSAIIGLIIALIYILVPRLPARKMFHVEQFKNTPHPNLLLIKEKELDVPRGTFLGGWNNFGKMKQFRFIILSVLIILLFTFIIIRPNIDSLLFNSLNERLFYLNVPRGTFESDPTLGIGAGQSVLMMQKFYSQTLESWQYQPVHNVFLLIFSELGLIGLGLFIWWLWKLFHACPPENCSTWNNFGRVEQKKKEITPLSLIRRRAGGEVEGKQENSKYVLHNDNTYLSSIIISKYFKGILLGLIFILLFDHYIWDIQQGSLIFWLTAGFIAGISRK